MVPRSDTENAKQQIHDDAEGQFAKPLKGKTHDGVASAKPTVITGSDDATVNKIPPGQKGPEKQWSLNYDPKDMNEGRYRG
ncbi:hypothetical protein LJR030_003148 [Rhizobium sp. LjRoot30]|uniref:hypothetical protein n=1 Tax=Rhizobium sp. LjRoot30 TaxID=3342320 RepID=UPI003ECF4715